MEFVMPFAQTVFLKYVLCQLCVGGHSLWQPVKYFNYNGNKIKY